MVLMFEQLDPVTLVLLVGVATYFLAGLVKSAVPFRVCQVCVAVAVSWMVLGAFSLAGEFRDPVLLALLVGQSIVGVYYALEKRARKSLLIFRLPFLLTVTVLVYSLVRPVETVGFLVLGLIWTTFLILAIVRSQVGTRVIHRFTDCCDE